MKFIYLFVCLTFLNNTLCSHKRKINSVSSFIEVSIDSFKFTCLKSYKKSLRFVPKSASSTLNIIDLVSEERYPHLLVEY